METKKEKGKRSDLNRQLLVHLHKSFFATSINIK